MHVKVNSQVTGRKSHSGTISSTPPAAPAGSLPTHCTLQSVPQGLLPQPLTPARVLGPQVVCVSRSGRSWHLPCGSETLLSSQVWRGSLGQCHRLQRALPSQPSSSNLYRKDSSVTGQCSALTCKSHQPLPGPCTPAPLTTSGPQNLGSSAH